MPSSYSTLLRIELIANGEKVGSWGSTTNVNLGTLIEQAISGRASVAMTDANYTLTTANGATDEARCAVIALSGTLTATRNVICPSTSKTYVVYNGTTGGQSIVFKTSGGTGVTVTNGTQTFLVCDGTNVTAVTPSLGTAALKNTGTSGNNVPLLDGVNTWSAAQTFTVAPAFTDQSGSRTAMGLGTMSTQAASSVAITGGSVTGLTAFSATSDARLKTDIEPLEEGLTYKLKPHRFMFNGKPSLGVLAQELREVLPELVYEDEEGILSVNYPLLCAVLIADLTDVNQRLEVLEAE